MAGFYREKKMEKQLEVFEMYSQMKFRLTFTASTTSFYCSKPEIMVE